MLVHHSSQALKRTVYRWQSNPRKEHLSNYCSMAAKPLPNSEKEISYFITRLPVGNTLQTVEIHEVDMCGWKLFECFLQQSDTIIYIGWDEDASVPEWIDMEDSVAQEQIDSLVHTISQQKKGKAA
jgi:hypothetical protein